MLALETHDLSKAYGSTRVLRDVNLRVEEGSLFGFLGPNGAGKTTTIRILLGLLRASAGYATVLGKRVTRAAAGLRSDVGYLPGDVRFYEAMTCGQTLAFLAAARVCDCKNEIERLAALLDLRLDRRVRDCSRGMKQKLGLIQALMHRPRLLILDEPTASLDPLVCESLYGLLREAVTGGGTVLFSSHTLSEVEQLCDHVAIVRDGELVEQARIDVLQQRALRRIKITFDPVGKAELAVPTDLHVIERDPEHLVGHWIGPARDLLTWLAASPIADVTITPPSLEDLFLEYYDRGRAPSPSQPGGAP